MAEPKRGLLICNLMDASSKASTSLHSESGDFMPILLDIAKTSNLHVYNQMSLQRVSKYAFVSTSL